MAVIQYDKQKFDSNEFMQKWNVDSFINEHNELGNGDLKTISEKLSVLADEYDSMGHHDVAEYFKKQSELIFVYVLEYRMNDSLDDTIELLQG